MRRHCGLTSCLSLFHNTNRRTVWSIGRTKILLSPTSRSRSAVQRLQLFSYHQGGQVPVRIILVRTSQLRLCLRKSMRDKAWECWLLSSAPEERSKCSSCKNLSLCVWLISHSKRKESCCDVRTQNETQEACRTYIPQEREHSPSIKKFGITKHNEQIKLPKGKRQPFQDSSEAGCHTRLQRNQDRKCRHALRESNGQIHSHRMEFYHANQICETSRWEQELESRERTHQETRIRTHQKMQELKKICCIEAERTQQFNYLIIFRKKRAGYAPNWKEKYRVLYGTRMRSLQEIEELKQLCCAEAERAKQLRIWWTFCSKRRSKSTVNQSAVQIQELQDKVNSLNDSRDFHDPSHPLIVPSSFGKLGRDSCLQPDTQNHMERWETFFRKSICIRRTDSILLKKCLCKKAYRYAWRACVSKRREIRSKNW